MPRRDQNGIPGIDVPAGPDVLEPPVVFQREGLENRATGLASASAAGLKELAKDQTIGARKNIANRIDTRRKSR